MANISEEEIICRFFARSTKAPIGIGDDAAVLAPSSGSRLAAATDALVSGIHFWPDDPPEALGHKSLAVNLSDLAAMGATPRWALLAVCLPEAREAWLKAFSQGFFALADTHGVELVGGDTIKGPLGFCVTLLGELPHDLALTRQGAREDDDIWVSGHLGAAALFLLAQEKKLSLFPEEEKGARGSFLFPTPRVALGQAILPVASACIDISDGLLADLGHICEASGVGAQVFWENIPVLPVFRRLLHLPLAQEAIACGGDDYELCFTAPPGARAALSEISQNLGLPLSCVGKIVPRQKVALLDKAGEELSFSRLGYAHF